jgi:uncharacterized membrane protein YeaQ/YmgE (transglycosylase-associated protein family)
MIGMSFLSFLLLLVISVIVAAIMHYSMGYRFLEGRGAYLAKVAIGWLGGWLGSPVLGYWSARFQNVYLIPAILGTITAIMLNVVALRALEKVFGGRLIAEKSAPGFPKAA